jgi:hypothetical protein
LTKVQVCNAEKPRCDIILQDSQICTVAVEAIRPDVAGGLKIG